MIVPDLVKAVTAGQKKARIDIQGKYFMNRRIQALAEQAGCTIDGMGYGEGNVEKFAELIVRECMEQVWYTREDGINGNVSEVIKDRMKQHFGVEE